MRVDTNYIDLAVWLSVVANIINNMIKANFIIYIYVYIWYF